MCNSVVEQLVPLRNYSRPFISGLKSANNSVTKSNINIRSMSSALLIDFAMMIILKYFRTLYLITCRFVYWCWWRCRDSPDYCCYNYWSVHASSHTKTKRYAYTTEFVHYKTVLLHVVSLPCSLSCRNLYWCWENTFKVNDL